MGGPLEAEQRTADVEQDVKRLTKVLTQLRAEESRQLDAETLELVKALRQDYEWARVLDDGSIAAVGRLFYTTALYLGMDRCGWERRFCYADSLQALEVLCALKSEDDEPEGWVARRPEHGPKGGPRQ